LTKFITIFTDLYNWIVDKPCSTTCELYKKISN